MDTAGRMHARGGRVYPCFLFAGKMEPPAVLEERKNILRKIFQALRQSPMFSHYSVEHIRDSAIKSEQLTYDRSRTRQEYMQAMHAKLLKIEKSYVMNTEEIMREMAWKKQQRTKDHAAGVAAGPEKYGPVLQNNSALCREARDSLLQEKEYSPAKKTGSEFVPLGKMQPETGFSFTFLGDDGKGGEKIGSRLQPSSMSRGVTSQVVQGPLHISEIQSPVEEGQGVSMHQKSVFVPIAPFDKQETIKPVLETEHKPKRMQIIRTGLSYVGTPGAKILGLQHTVGPDQGIVPLVPMSVLDDTSCRSVRGRDMLESLSGSAHMQTPFYRPGGAAGSTNTVTKLNNSSFLAQNITGKKAQSSVPLPRTEIAEQPEQDEEQEEAADTQSSGPQKKAGTDHELSLDEIECVEKEIESMQSVLCAHRTLFVHGKAQRKVLEELDAVLRERIKKEKCRDAEQIHGVLQQMKKQVILLSNEIQHYKTMPFRRRLLRVSAAFLYKMQEQPEYRFFALDGRMAQE